MSQDGRNDVRFLKWYAYGATTVVIALAILAFRQSQNPHFKEIDVQRINVREPDGTLRMTISNHAMIPDPVIGGESYPLRSGTGGAGAGMIFFNDEGNEDGGFTYTGKKTPDGHSAGMGLTFDQYNQDETMTLSYDDKNGRRAVGMSIQDRPEGSIGVFADSAMAIKKLPDGPEKTRRLQAIRDNMKGYYGSTQRVYVGKGDNKESAVVLSDPQGHARILMMVDSLGTPTLKFLDASGKVTYSIPATGK